jgi:hypothetical protein
VNSSAAYRPTFLKIGIHGVNYIRKPKTSQQLDGDERKKAST